MGRNYQRVGTIAAPSGLTGAKFGYSTVISGDGSTIAIGVLPNTGVTALSDIAYVALTAQLSTTQPLNIPSHNMTLQAQNVVSGDTALLGIVVVISADGRTIAVGDPNSNSATGTAYIVTRSNQLTLSPSIMIMTGGVLYQTGQSMSLSGDGQALIVGSVRASSGNNMRFFQIDQSSGWTNPNGYYHDVSFFARADYLSLTSTNYDSSNGLLVVCPLNNSSVGITTYQAHYPTMPHVIVANDALQATKSPTQGGEITTCAVSADGNTIALVSSLFSNGTLQGTWIECFSCTHSYNNVPSQNILSRFLSSNIGTITHSDLFTSICLNSDGNVGLATNQKQVYVFDISVSNTAVNLLSDSFITPTSVSLSYDGAIAVVGDVAANNNYGAVYVYADRFAVSNFTIPDYAVAGNNIHISFTPTFSNYGSERTAIVQITCGTTMLSDFTVRYGTQINSNFGPIPSTGTGNDTITITLTDAVTNFTTSVSEVVGILDIENVNIDASVALGNNFHASFTPIFARPIRLGIPAYPTAHITVKIGTTPLSDFISWYNTPVSASFGPVPSGIVEATGTITVTVTDTLINGLTKDVSKSISLIQLEIHDSIIDTEVEWGGSFQLTFMPTSNAQNLSPTCQITVAMYGTILSDFQATYGTEVSAFFGPVPFVQSSPAYNAAVTIALTDTQNSNYTTSIVSTINIVSNTQQAAEDNNTNRITVQLCSTNQTGITTSTSQFITTQTPWTLWGILNTVNNQPTLSSTIRSNMVFMALYQMDSICAWSVVTANTMQNPFIGSNPNDANRVFSWRSFSTNSLDKLVNYLKNNGKNSIVLLANNSNYLCDSNQQTISIAAIEDNIWYLHYSGFVVNADMYFFNRLFAANAITPSALSIYPNLLYLYNNQFLFSDARMMSSALPLRTVPQNPCPVQFKINIHSTFAFIGHRYMLPITITSLVTSGSYTANFTLNGQSHTMNFQSNQADLVIDNINGPVADYILSITVTDVAFANWSSATQTTTIHVRQAIHDQIGISTYSGCGSTPYQLSPLLITTDILISGIFNYTNNSKFILMILDTFSASPISFTDDQKDTIQSSILDLAQNLQSTNQYLLIDETVMSASPTDLMFLRTLPQIQLAIVYASSTNKTYKDLENLTFLSINMQDYIVKDYGHNPGHYCFINNTNANLPIVVQVQAVETAGACTLDIIFNGAEFQSTILLGAPAHITIPNPFVASDYDLTISTNDATLLINTDTVTLSIKQFINFSTISCNDINLGIAFIAMDGYDGSVSNGAFGLHIKMTDSDVLINTAVFANAIHTQGYDTGALADNSAVFTGSVFLLL